MRHTCLLIFLVAQIAAATPYLPPTTPGDDSWASVDPTSIGLDTTALADLETWLGTVNTGGFLMLHRGRIVTERYYDTWDLHTTYPLYSASKTIVATMMLMAVEDGLLTLSDSASSWLGPGWSSATPEQESAITIVDLLTMSSGLDSDLSYLAAPQSVWQYNDEAYHQTHAILASATGQLRQTFSEAWLFTDLGMHDSNWNLTQRRINASTRDMARFGLFLLRNGRWNGVDLITDVNHLVALRSPSQALNPSYGLLTWLNGQSSHMLPADTTVYPGPLIPSAPADCYAAMGAADKRIYVIPSLDLVVVRHGDAAFTAVNAASAFDEALWTRLAPIVAPLATATRRVSLNTVPGASWQHAGDMRATPAETRTIFVPLERESDHVFSLIPVGVNQ